MSDFEAWARANKLSLSINADGRVHSAARWDATYRVVTQELRVEAGADYGKFYFQEFLRAPHTCIRGPVWIGSNVNDWNTYMWGNP